jgi:hypothetical protein
VLLLRVGDLLAQFFYLKVKLVIETLLLMIVLGEEGVIIFKGLELLVGTV